jgi:hypothetical protein
VTAGIISRAQVRRELDYDLEQAEKIESEIMEETATSDPLKGMI